LMLEKVVSHFARINEITVQEAKTLVSKCMGTHAARSRRPWIMKVAEHLLSTYPDLSLLNTGAQRIFPPKVRPESISTGA
jgi:hypothetical protein